MRPSAPRVILHLDMDAFYAAVEVRERPELAGRPLIIGHRGRRGVVSTCSYEARAFGVRSAMPSVSAERLCPQACWLPGRMALYVDVSRSIRAVLRDFSPLVEPISIDEAFLDLTGIACDLDAGATIARRIKRRIRDSERLSASVGVAPNKFLAKLASDLEKPDGLTVLPAADVESRIWPLPVERLWGVGPRTAARLREAGLPTVGSIANAARERLAALVGAGSAASLHALAHGRDERPVVAGRRAKSISEERTYGEDLTKVEEIDRALFARCEGVARQLRREGLVARTVHLKVRGGDFTTWSRSHTLAEPSDLADPLLTAARALFADRIRLDGRGVRLLGVGVSGLDRAGRGQGALFEDDETARHRRLARLADAVRDRHGEGAIVRARLVRGPAAETDGEASSLPAVD